MAVLTAAAVGLGIYLYLAREAEDSAISGIGAPIVKVMVPETVSAQAQIGQQIFAAKCEACPWP